MHHLNLEELARLVDKAPTASEREHLARCALCGAELEQMRLQTARLTQLPDPVMPDIVRRRIAQALEAETPLLVAGSAFDGRWRNIAAGVMFFVIGGATGTFVVAPGLERQTQGVGAAAGTSPDPAASLVAAEAEYLQALANFARINYSSDGLDPLNRLAALEGIVLTTRAALREAPADPVINNYHLTALGQRDELLRQIEDGDRSDEWF